MTASSINSGSKPAREGGGFDLAEVEAASRMPSRAEQAAVRKVDWRLLPFLSFCYLASYLDRSNVANARIVNNNAMERDLQLKESQLHLAIAVFYAGYVFFEVPSNLMLRRATPRVWIARIMVTWGIACCCIGAVQNAAGLIAVRLFLGAFEAGFVPGVVLYMTFWYTPHERSWRIVLFICASTVANVMGAVCSWAIAHMDGALGLAAWRWIFIIEGLPTVLCGLICFWYLPNYPETAEFLTEDERHLIVNRLEGHEVNKQHDKHFDKDEFWSALTDPDVYLFCIMLFCNLTPLLGYTYSLPMIITQLGYHDMDAQLMCIPIYAAAFFISLGIARLADRYRNRSAAILFDGVLAILGFLGMMILPTPQLKYAAAFLPAIALHSNGSPILAWITVAQSGSTFTALSTALAISAGNLGGLAAAYLYPKEDKPDFKMGNITCLCLLVIKIFSVLALRYRLARRNRPV